jgi:glycosyltransferase involved in cell wall biosynthesis
MRLLIVDEEIIAGGVDTLRRQLIPALAGLVEAIVWVLPAHVTDQFSEVEKSCGNLLIETLNSPGGLPRVQEAVARRIRGEIPRDLIDERLRWLARQHRCDICMTTCVFGQEMPDVDLPVTGFVADINPALPERILANIGKWVEKAAATFSISDFICSELKRFKPGCSERIHSIPLAGPGKVETGRKGAPGHFYYPAVPHEHKGHLTLLEAARGLASRGLDFHLTLTGAGMDEFSRPDGGNEVIRRMRAYLTEHAELLDQRAVVAGDAKAAEIERLFSESSCVVLPSSYEGFGLPLAEALGYGKRIICSDIAPFREQVARYGCEELTTFVPAGSALALEKAMAEHLSGGEGPGLTPEELAERLNRWTWTDAARRCHALLEGVASHG